MKNGEKEKKKVKEKERLVTMGGHWGWNLTSSLRSAFLYKHLFSLLLLVFILYAKYYTTPHYDLFFCVIILIFFIIYLYMCMCVYI